MLLAPAALADYSHVPLPGLETKGHLWHLTRDDVAIDKLFPHNITGPIGDGSGAEVHDWHHFGPNTDEQSTFLEEQRRFEEELAR